MVQKYASELAGFFSEDSWPTVRCPICGQGTLAVRKTSGTPAKDDISSEHSSKVRDWNDWGDPTDIEGTFCAILKCNRSECGDIVVASGEMGVDINTRGYHDPDASQYETVYKVRSFYPPIRVAEHPPTVPTEVVAHLDRVSALVWLDPAAAMTAIRTAVESLMTAQGISATTASGKFATLDDRLKSFQTVNEDMATLLFAAKWVGNAGTHEDDNPTAKDVLEVLEFVEIALSALYAPDHTAALERARRINTERKLVP